MRSSMGNPEQSSEMTTDVDAALGRLLCTIAKVQEQLDQLSFINKELMAEVSRYREALHPKKKQDTKKCSETTIRVAK